MVQQVPAAAGPADSASFVVGFVSGTRDVEVGPEAGDRHNPTLRAPASSGRRFALKPSRRQLSFPFAAQMPGETGQTSTHQENAGRLGSGEHADLVNRAIE